MLSKFKEILELLIVSINTKLSFESCVLFVTADISRTFYSNQLNNQLAKIKNKLLRMFIIFITSLVALCANLLVVTGDTFKPEEVSVVKDNNTDDEIKRYYDDFTIKEISNIQNDLKSLDYLEDVNGLVDDNFIKSVRNFQRDNELVVDGKVGEKTLKRLHKSIEDKAK